MSTGRAEYQVDRDSSLDNQDNKEASLSSLNATLRTRKTLVRQPDPAATVTVLCTFTIKAEIDGEVVKIMSKLAQSDALHSKASNSSSGLDPFPHDP